jgi:hypothetical protein
MAGLCELDPLNFFNAAEERCTHIVCGKVKFTIDEKRRNPNEVHFARYVPTVVLPTQGKTKER